MEEAKEEHVLEPDRKWTNPIRQKIKEAREKIKSSKEREEKKEISKQLRMEVQLKTSAMADEILKTMMQNPDIKKEELLELLKEKNVYAHKKAAEHLYGFIKDDIQNVREVREKSQEEAEKKQKNIEDVLFDSLLPPKEGAKPDGEIEVNFEDNPLAVEVFIEKHSDRKKLAIPFESSFYKGRYNFRFEGNSIEAPIIVLETRERKTLVHERKHSSNRALISTMWSMRRHESMWGGVSVKKLGKLKPAQEKPNFSHVDDTVQYALGKAKDEILAMASEHEFRKLSTAGLKKRLLQDKKYDYMERWLNLDNTSQLYQKAREKYEQSLIPVIEELGKLYSLIQAPELKRRRDLMPYVLAQVPVSKWQETIDTYKDEIKPYSKTSLELEEQKSYFNSLEELGVNLTQDDMDAQKALEKFESKFRQEVADNCHLPLYDLLAEKKEEFENVNEQVENTPAFRVQKTSSEIEKIVKDFDSKSDGTKGSLAKRDFDSLYMSMYDLAEKMNAQEYLEYLQKVQKELLELYERA